MQRGATRWRPAASVGTAVLLLGLVACTPGSDESPQASGTAPGGDRPAATGAADELILPIDEYSFTFPELMQIERARQLLARDCMRRFGFDYVVDAAQSDQRTQVMVKDFGVHGNKRRYGPTDMTFAGKFGYHSPSDVDGSRRAAQGAEKEKAEGSAAQSLVLSGKAPEGRNVPKEVNGQPLPEGGCLGEADTKIDSAGKVGEADLVARIARDSFNRSLQDPAVAAAFRKWSDCMKEKGYSYPSPGEAGGDFDTGTQTISPKEIAAAKADVTCKQQTKLVDIWRGFEVDYQNGEIDKHEEELRKIKTDHGEQLKRVATIVAGS